MWLKISRHYEIIMKQDNCNGICFHEIIPTEIYCSHIFGTVLIKTVFFLLFSYVALPSWIAFCAVLAWQTSVSNYNALCLVTSSKFRKRKSISLSLWIWKPCTEVQCCYFLAYFLIMALGPISFTNMLFMINYFTVLLYILWLKLKKNLVLD
jgi:hypothetical protein